MAVSRIVHICPNNTCWLVILTQKWLTCPFHLSIIIQILGLDPSIIEMIKQKLRESDCYINQPFLAETFCMTAQIASLGDKLHIFYNLCATHDGNSCAYEGFCPQDKRLYECASAKTMHTIHGIPGYRMRGSTTPRGVFSCLTSRGLDRVWGL